MVVVNDQLRAARERTASRTYPGECVSRQELAELVNAYLWEHHHTMVELGAGYIGKLERGVIRWPGRLYREALRVILAVPTDAALGFANARRAVVRLVDVDRKQFLQTAALGVSTLALAPVAAALESSAPTQIPTRVGATEIAQIRAAARVFQSWEHTYGGGLTCEAVQAQLRWTAGLLNAACPARMRPELFSAVGDLAIVAGYTAWDAGAQQEEVRRVLRFALGCAEQAENWSLRAQVLSAMATQTTETGRPDEGLTLAEQALVRADRLTATERAMLHTNRARSLATMARVGETLDAVGTADDHFAHSTPANDPPFIAYYTTARHTQYAGQALADLALLGRSRAEAHDQLASAVAGHTAGYARSRTITRTKLASLTMATGDPIEAAALGTAALDAAGAIRSRRVADDLRELARYTNRHQHVTEVAALRQRITAAVLPS